MDIFLSVLAALVVWSLFREGYYRVVDSRTAKRLEMESITQFAALREALGRPPVQEEIKPKPVVRKSAAKKTK